MANENTNNNVDRSLRTIDKTPNSFKKRYAKRGRNSHDYRPWDISSEFTIINMLNRQQTVRTLSSVSGMEINARLTTLYTPVTVDLIQYGISTVGYSRTFSYQYSLAAYATVYGSRYRDTTVNEEKERNNFSQRDRKTVVGNDKDHITRDTNDTTSMVKEREIQRSINEGDSRAVFQDPPPLEASVVDVSNKNVTAEDVRRNFLQGGAFTDDQITEHFKAGVTSTLNPHNSGLTATNLTGVNAAGTIQGIMDARKQIQVNGVTDGRANGAIEWAMMVGTALKSNNTNMYWYQIKEEDIKALGDVGEKILTYPEYQSVKNVLLNVKEWTRHLNAGIPGVSACDGHMGRLRTQGADISTDGKVNNARVLFNVVTGGSQTVHIGQSYFRVFYFGNRTNYNFGQVRDYFMEPRGVTVEEDKLLVRGPSVQHFAGKMRRTVGQHTRPAGISDAIYRYEGGLSTEQVTTKPWAGVGKTEEDFELDQFIQGIHMQVADVDLGPAPTALLAAKRAALIALNAGIAELTVRTPICATKLLEIEASIAETETAIDEVAASVLELRTGPIPPMEMGRGMTVQTPFRDWSAIRAKHIELKGKQDELDTLKGSRTSLANDAEAMRNRMAAMTEQATVLTGEIAILSRPPVPNPAGAPTPPAGPRLSIRSPNLWLAACAPFDYGAAHSEVYAYLKTEIAGKKLTMYGEAIAITTGNGAVADTKILLEEDQMDIQSRKLNLTAKTMSFKTETGKILAKGENLFRAKTNIFQ
jgi:hypothetical protein